MQKLPLPLVFCAILLVLTCSQPFASQPMSANAVYQTITRQSGWLNTSRALTEDDLHGRIILLDFWTFCCINCMHVIPDLKYLEHTFGDKLTVIGVHSAKFQNERDTENIRNAILRYGIEHPVVNDFDFAIWQRFGINAWPTFVLIAPNGYIANVYSGEGNREAVEKDVRSLLAKHDGKLVTSPLPIALERSKAPSTPLAFPGKAIPSQRGLWVADSGHHRIVEIGHDGTILTTIGSGVEGYQDGSFATAQFRHPQGMAYQNGILYIADTENHTLRAANFATQQVTTLAGTGKQGYERRADNAPALKTPLASPWDVAFYPDQQHLVIAMAGTHQLWSYNLAKKTVSVIAGNGRESIDDGRYPHNSLSQPSGLAVVGDKLYFVDSETSSLRVLENDSITTLIGTGLFDFGYREGKQGEAQMQHPLGIYADDSGVYIADSYNHAIRRYDPATGKLHNFAGTGKRGLFNEPGGLTRVGDMLYIADTNNQQIQRLPINGGTPEPLRIAESTNYQLATDLPNLQPLDDALVQNGVALTVRIQLEPGWKINHEAPSYLALFEENKLIQGFSNSAVEAKSLTLPALSAGHHYRLQGSFYYCRDVAGSQCLIKSIDQRLTAGQKGVAELLLTL